MTNLNYRNIILNELEVRQRKNSSYNLSSLARHIDIPASRLSEILRGKVGLSMSKAESIATTLNFTGTEKQLFLDMVCAEHGRSPRDREQAQKRLDAYQNEYPQINDENFTIVADWYHHAITELITLKPDKTIKEISESLGIDESIAMEALQRLISLKLIERNGNEHHPVTTNRETTRDVPSEAIKKLNEQILEKAAYELRVQDVDNRDFSIAFLSFNKSQMAQAKERIKEFRRGFMKEFESATGKDAVYCAAIQFFELTGNEEIKN